VTSAAKSDYKAVVAYTGSNPINVNQRRKQNKMLSYRRETALQGAL